MKAIVVTGSGSPEVLELKEVDKPSPRDNEMLIRVKASTVTFGEDAQNSNGPVDGSDGPEDEEDPWS